MRGLSKDWSNWGRSGEDANSPTFAEALISANVESKSSSCSPPAPFNNKTLKIFEEIANELSCSITDNNDRNDLSWDVKGARCRCVFSLHTQKMALIM